MIDNMQHNFGGKWTVEKLNILSSYLSAYLKVLKNQSFKKIYIDAFAGNGKITLDGQQEEIEGSVRLALNAEEKFDEYIFIEKRKTFAKELESIVEKEFPTLKNRVKIINADCNDMLNDLCQNTDWASSRAMLFLDPYATEVKYETLKTIAETQAIDVWYLFPFGATQRMLPRDGNVYDSWKLKLNSLFGDENWYDTFYIPDPQQNFFGDENMIKNVNTNELSKYIVRRLQTIFPAVSPNPRLLWTSKAPLFLFCFAVANPSDKAIGRALNIANYILDPNN